VGLPLFFPGGIVPPVQRARDFFEPWTSDEDRALWNVIAAAIGSHYVDVETLVGDTDDGMLGWERLVDPHLCPDWALPWLAMVVGVRIPQGMNAVEVRGLLHPDSNRRGTPGAVIAAVKTTLIGGRRVELEEGVDGPYRHVLRTYDIETPSPALTEAVLNSPLVKPVGHWFTYQHYPGISWLELRDENGGRTWRDVRDEFPTWNDVLRHLP
jgi:hypothetical protein